MPTGRNLLFACIFSALGLLLLSLIYYNVSANMSPMKDKITYPAIVKDWKAELASDGPESAGLMDHFPPTIPRNATNVLFYDDGRSVQVRYGLPPEEIEQLYLKFDAEKTGTVDGGDFNQNAIKPNGLYTTWFYTSGSSSTEFPQDYRIMVLDKNPIAPEHGNHGQSHGVAISKKRNEIVYWSEWW